MGKTRSNIVTAASSVNEKAIPAGVVTVAALLRGNAIPHLEATVLLAQAWGRSRESVLAHTDKPVDSQLELEFRALVEQRLAGMPIAYLTRSREFYGIELEVTPAVLIPRPDTELLVDAALERVDRSVPTTILDLGTGSGAIAIALALNRRCASVEAVDVSDAAVEVALRNAARHQVGNIDIHRADWYDGVRRATYDVIVSNPPYINGTDPHLLEGDVRFEPRVALVSGTDGLDAIRTIVAGALRYLNPGGHLLIEHGYDQGAACRTLFVDAGLDAVLTLRDLGGQERVCAGRAPER